MKIDKPGIFYDVSEEDYRNDPCPSPSLTQSLIKILIERSPQHAWFACPSLNPDHEPDSDTKFDLGNIVHRLVLGRGKDIEVIQFDDWRKKAAQDAREEAAEQGKIAVLQHQFEQATEMAAAAWRQLERHEDRDAFQNGRSEVMIAWQEGGIWLRSLIDHLTDDLRTVTDFKSTGMSVADHVLGQRAIGGMWHLQMAFIERGLDALDPAGAGRRRYRNIAQETDKPHALNVMRMDEHWLTLGRKHVEAGISKWIPAIKTNHWRGYSTRSITPEYPAFHENKWLERELSGEFENEPSLVMAG